MRVLAITLTLAAVLVGSFCIADLKAKNEDLTLSAAALGVEIDLMRVSQHVRESKLLGQIEQLRINENQVVIAWETKATLLGETIEGLKREVDSLYRNQLPQSFIEDDRPNTVTQTFQRNGYVYRIVTYNIGTKSESFDAFLFKDDEEILGGDLWGPRQYEDTPWGEMVWLGNPEYRKVTFQCCGWQIVHRSDDEVEVQ